VEELTRTATIRPNATNPKTVSERKRFDGFENGWKINRAMTVEEGLADEGDDSETGRHGWVYGLSRQDRE
jgi:hypothetical protein